MDVETVKPVAMVGVVLKASEWKRSESVMVV